MIEINHILWFIKFVPSFDLSLRRDDGSYTIGMCNDSERMIYIDGSLRGRLLRKVLCHEIVHAAMFSYNVLLTVDQEELIADLIATYGTEIIDITNKVFKKIGER